MISYALTFSTDDNGTILVTCPDLPEVTTFGASPEDAKARAVNAIEEAIAARLHDWRDIPQPSRATPPLVSLPTLTALKLQLYWSLCEQGVTRAELARRLGWRREQVDRLFRLDHRSRLDQIDAAFRALGRRLEFAAVAA